MRSRENCAKGIPLTRSTTTASRLYPVLLYEYSWPGSKLSALWRLTMSSTCACRCERAPRPQPEIEATEPQSRIPLVWVMRRRRVTGDP